MVLFASVAVAARSVAFEVLSTLPNPTSPLTKPAGALIVAPFKVLFANVSTPAKVARIPDVVGKVKVRVVPVV